MAEARGLERLSASDLYVLVWDDFGWSGNIGVLAVLDGTGLLDGDGRVRIEAVRRHLEPRLHMVPHFRQRLYRPGLGLGWPLWVDAASFDLADHVRVFPLAAPGGQDQLLQACEQLAQRRLDPVPAAMGGLAAAQSVGRWSHSPVWRCHASDRAPPQRMFAGLVVNAVVLGVALVWWRGRKAMP